jgi:hypothetical protein
MRFSVTADKTYNTVESDVNVFYILSEIIVFI